MTSSSFRVIRYFANGSEQAESGLRPFVREQAAKDAATSLAKTLRAMIRRSGPSEKLPTHILVREQREGSAINFKVHEVAI